MLDEDLADLYGVETKRLIQQVKRNLKRFPENFMFQLDSAEAEALRSQIATSKRWYRGGRRYAPCVFTEQGVAMLSGFCAATGQSRSTSRSWEVAESVVAWERQSEPASARPDRGFKVVRLSETRRTWTGVP